MRTETEIINKIIILQNRLDTLRRNIKMAGGYNKDLSNEPLFNQIESLKWVINNK